MNDLTHVTFRMSGAELKAHAANGRTKIGRAARAEITRRSAKRVPAAPVAPAPVAAPVDPVKAARKALTAQAQAFAEAQDGGFTMRVFLAERTRLLRQAGIPRVPAGKGRK